MNKKTVEEFLLARRGYWKKSPLEAAKSLWKIEGLKQKSKKEIEKDLELVKTVHSDIKQANKQEESQLVRIYNELKTKEKKEKLLYLDIETSPNIVFSWNVGHKINISHDNIINERAVICVCYKWEHEKEVKSLQWKNGDDKELLEKFAIILNSADIICGHNIQRFDLPWLRTRALYHGIKLNTKFNQIDTLQLARWSFRLNSNRLDYINKFLGGTGKTETGFNLWKDIVLKNDKIAMNTMVNYCKNDIKILEEVHKKLKEYTPKRKFKSII